jgi:hypothetical protein
MNNIQVHSEAIPTMSPGAIDQVRSLEALAGTVPQADLETRHVIHGGMYSRTITLPSGHVLVGTLTKVPTLLIVHGCGKVYLGDGSAEFSGYGVIPASSGRKQVFLAYSDIDITMIFPTSADNVEDAEAEFTDEADLLVSRKSNGTNVVNITGE